ncbi:hypothetical protein JW968_06100 [Candidatus Woesearchaeota archaeon]|nr:hypothetical protein [Candidatus Woesearchaeota archaeon]
MRDIDRYLEQHLMHYIREELNSGYSLDSIEKVLLGHGHHPNLIRKVIADLSRHGFRPFRQREYVEGLEAELYSKIMHAIYDYIVSQKRKGFSVSEIKRVLLDYGHSSEMIEEAVNVVLNEEPELEKSPKKKGKKGSYALLVSSLIILFFILFTAISANVSLMTVFLAYAPMVITLLCLEFFSPRVSARGQLLVIPVAVVVIFYVLAVQLQLGNFQSMEMRNILALDFIVSLFISVLYLFK